MNKMKRFGLLVCAMAMALMSLSSMAQSYITPPPALKAFSSQATGTTLASYVISANGAGPLRLTYVNATSDKAASVIQFYQPSNAILITAAGAASQAVITAVGTGNFAGSDVCVVHHVAADTYERLVVSSVNATTVTFTANLAAAVVAGDKVYKMAASGKVACGAATKEIINSGGVYNSKPGLPVLVDLDGTSACTINLLSGVFENR